MIFFINTCEQDWHLQCSQTPSTISHPAFPPNFLIKIYYIQAISAYKFIYKKEDPQKLI